MKTIDKIRGLPKERKIQIIWICVIVVLALLLGFWIVIGNYKASTPPDFSLFKTIGKGIRDFNLNRSNSIRTYGQ